MRDSELIVFYSCGHEDVSHTDVLEEYPITGRCDRCRADVGISKIATPDALIEADLRAQLIRRQSRS